MKIDKKKQKDKRMKSINAAHAYEITDFTQFLMAILRHLHLNTVFHVASLPTTASPFIHIERARGEAATEAQLRNMELLLRALRGRNYCTYSETITAFSHGVINTIPVAHIGPDRFPSASELASLGDKYFNTFNPNHASFRLEAAQAGPSNFPGQLVQPNPRAAALNPVETLGQAPTILNAILEKIELKNRFIAVLDSSGVLKIQALSNLSPGNDSRNKLLALARTLRVLELVAFNSTTLGEDINRPVVSLSVNTLAPRLIFKYQNNQLNDFISTVLLPAYLDTLQVQAESDANARRAAVPVNNVFNFGRSPAMYQANRGGSELARIILALLVEGQARRRVPVASPSPLREPEKPSSITPEKWDAIPAIIKKYWEQLSAEMHTHVIYCLEQNIEAAIGQLGQLGLNSAVLSDANRDVIMGTTPRFPIQLPGDEVMGDAADRNDLVTILLAYEAAHQQRRAFNHPQARAHERADGVRTTTIGLEELMPALDTLAAIQANIAGVLASPPASASRASK